MKTTIVPAQITTVEDRVAGNLSFNQLILLIIPVFLGGAIFTFVPPFITYTLFKATVVVLVAMICCSLAIRIKGRLIIEWIIIRAKYNLRPRLHVFSKNSMYLRPIAELEKEIIEETKAAPIKQELLPLVVSYPELVRVESVIADPRANLQFKRSRKGVLNVHISEIK